MSALMLTQLGNLVYPDRPITYGIVQPGPDISPEGIPLIRGKDYSGGKVDTSELYHVLPSIDKPYARSKVRAGDILLSIVGYLGQVAEVPESMEGANITQTTARISVDPAKACAHYLFQYFQSAAFRDEVRKFEKGSAQPGLNLSDLAKFEVHLTPRSEQTKIAEILSTVDRAIEQTEALIAKQQRLKTGLMQDLLTRGIDEHGNLRSEQTHKFKESPLGRIPVEWEVKSVESKLECIIDYRGRTPVKTDSGIPLITAKNVREGFLCEEPREFIAVDAYDSWMTRGIPEPGDVMITTEAPMGNVARVPGYKIALAQRLITLPTKKNELSSDFLFWMLHWSRTLERLELLTSGSTVVGIKQSVFRKVDFSFPPLDEQSKIAAPLNAERDTAETNLKHLSKLRALKTALMQDLLTGRKRVTNLLASNENNSKPR